MTLFLTDPSPSPYADPMRLVEREAELRLLAEAVDCAVSGQGVGIAIAGESGAGKSSLVSSVLAGLGTGVRVLVGQCDPLQTPRPLGPFRDLDLGGLVERIGTGEALPSDLGEWLYTQVRSQPTVLVVEDLHWLDELSADLLRFLARRVESAPLALLVTYRDLEIGPRHPARQLLADFATQDGLNTIALRPLSLEGVSELAEGTDLDPVRVLEVTAGNPFFVSAVVREPDLPMPSSVRDVVLARTASVDDADLEVLQLVALAPDGLADRVLPRLGVDLPTLRRLDETGLLTRTDAGLAYRHELARLAVVSTIPLGGAVVLHSRLLTALETLQPQDPAVLTHHAVAAQDSDRALRHALAAADEAAAAASNTEACAFLEIAVDHLPSEVSDDERVGLTMRLASQQYRTGQLAEAVDSAKVVIRMLADERESKTAVFAHGLIGVAEYSRGRRRPCEEHLALACRLAEASGDADAIARAHFDAAIIAWCKSDLAAVVSSARRIADVAGDVEEYAVAARLVAASVPSILGEPGAREQVLAEAENARDLGLVELAWRGYLFTAASDFQHGDVRALTRLVDDVVSYSTDRDNLVAFDWFVAIRGIAHFLSGRWQAAVEDSHRALTAGQIGSNFSTMILGLTDLRLSGDDPRGMLEECWSVTCSIDEPLRYLPALAALAESMWMTGREDGRVTRLVAERLPEFAALPDCRHAAGDLVVWLRRLGLPHDTGVELPEPYRSHLEGRVGDAADWWRRAGSPFNEAMAWADSSEVEHRLRAVTMLDTLGAVGTADRLRVTLRREGVTAVPRRPRESTFTNPGGLTNRQLEVARLVAQGMSNNEIAAKLYISPKTADHHVSAILMKLGLPHRRAVVVQASQLGLA